jgi:hypothetical protein
VPRIRSVKPDLWNDEAVGEISLQARLTFIGLITQADDDGRQKGSPKLVRSLLFPYDDFTVPEVSGWLRELSGKGLIVQYEVGGKQFIELPSWHSHQKISHPTESALPSRSEADSVKAPEDSGDDPEASTLIGRDRRGEEGKGTESPVETADAELSHLLADLVAANDPDGKRPTVSKEWAVEEDRMLRLDERKPAEARRLIEWTQASSFWRKNVRSMPKFREQYGQLYLAAVEEAERKRAQAPEPESRRTSEDYEASRRRHLESKGVKVA